MAEASDDVKAFRRAVSGQDEEPVTVETDGAAPHLGAAEHDHEPTDLSVSAEDVVEQLQKHDPLLLELLALRAVVGRL